MYSNCANLRYQLDQEVAAERAQRQAWRQQRSWWRGVQRWWSAMHRSGQVE